MNAIVFPGQGSQKIGMGTALLQAASTRARFDEASHILGYDLATLCLEGPAEKLTQTLYAQPALLVVGVAAWETARESGLQAHMAAGHSLGEYAALVAAQALGFEDAVKLVQQRATLMSQAPRGTMAALIGLPDEELPRVLADALKAGEVVAANYNSPGQVVISGTQEGVERAMQIARERGAKRALALSVSGAFHSPLMKDAAQQMAQLIDDAPFRDATIPVYQNATARPATSAQALKSALKQQMTGAVLWTQTIQKMRDDGATSFHELGSGKVLTGLIKRIAPEVEAVSSDA